MSRRPEAPVGLSRHADRDLRRAWVAVGLLPVGFVLAMVVGEGLRGPRTATFPHQHEPAQVRQVRPGKVVERGPLISAMGYQSGGEEPIPVGPTLVAGVPALLILVVPGMAAVYIGRRAAHGGRAAAMVLAWIGGVAAVAVVTQNLLALLLGG